LGKNLYFFDLKKCNLLIHKGRPATASARKRELPAFEKLKILSFFLFLCVIFALLDQDPDPEAQINADPQLWFYILNFSAPLEFPRAFM